MDQARVMTVIGRWVASVMCAVCIAASAEEGSVEFSYRRAPAWPSSLLTSGVSGWVLFDIQAHHDGRVSEPQVLESSHPLMSRAVMSVVPSWRVEPWAVSTERPAVISLRQEHYFLNPREGTSPVTWLHRRLRHLTCTTFNKHMEDFHQTSSALEVIEMSVFRHTYKVLARVATYRKLTDEQRFELGDALAEAVPDVIQRCRENPALRYKEVLPHQVSRML